MEVSNNDINMIKVPVQINYISKENPESGKLCNK